MKKQQEVPESLNKITDVVLAYHPKARHGKPKKRRSQKKKKGSKQAAHA